VRVLILLDRLSVGGAERHAAQLARLLPAKGVEVVLAVYHGKAASNFPVAELPPNVIMMERGSFNDPREWRALGKLVREHDIDLVAAVNQSALVVAAFSRLLGFHRARVICLFHTTIINSLAGRLKLPVFYLASAVSDAVVFVSRNQERHWRRSRLFSPRMHAIPNGVDVTAFSPPSPAEKQAARAAAGVAGDDLVVSLCARFAPEKNQRQLVEAAKILRDRGVGVKILLIGAGPLQDEVRQMTKDAGLEEIVLFCGEHRDVRPLLRAADVCVLCSTSVETFSLAALEGMATGLAAVLSDIGGASEMVSSGENGFLFPAGDTLALVDALTRLSEPGAAARMGGVARERVVRDFTIQRMVGDYADYLPQLVSGRGK
jgi:glycosyltransferase involved in cell wall biosynthesis